MSRKGFRRGVTCRCTPGRSSAAAPDSEDQASRFASTKAFGQLSKEVDILRLGDQGNLEHPLSYSLVERLSLRRAFDFLAHVIRHDELETGQRPTEVEPRHMH